MKKQHLQAFLAILVTLLLPIFFLKRSYLIESRAKHISTKLSTPHQYEIASREKEFLILVPITTSHPKMMDQAKSIFSQNYTKYRVVYLIDGTQQLSQTIEQLIDTYGHRSNFTCEVISGDENILSQYEGIIRSSSDNEVVIHLGENDLLAATNVLEQLNYIYCTEDIWLTYSQSDQRGATSKKWSIKKSQQKNWVHAPMKSYYVSVFKQLAPEEIEALKGKSFNQIIEIIMAPMAEFSQRHIRYVPDIISHSESR